MYAARLVQKDNIPVKVLASGEIDKALTVQAQAFSARAKAKIEAAGGKAEVI
jgi:large subunit ribosomal protein L15